MYSYCCKEPAVDVSNAFVYFYTVHKISASKVQLEKEDCNVAIAGSPALGNS